jgi:hypothetical protein
VWLYVKKPEGVIKNEQRSVNYTSRVTSQRKYQPPRIVFDVLVASQNLFKILKIHISKLKCTCVQNMIRCIIHYKKLLARLRDQPRRILDITMVIGCLGASAYPRDEFTPSQPSQRRMEVC